MTPEELAKERAVKLVREMANVAGVCFDVSPFFNRAREIGADLPPEVDPLLIEAREIMIAREPNPNFREQYRGATEKGWLSIQLVMAGLRRGIEIGKGS